MIALLTILMNDRDLHQEKGHDKDQWERFAFRFPHFVGNKTLWKRWLSSHVNPDFIANKAPLQFVFTVECRIIKSERAPEYLLDAVPKLHFWGVLEGKGEDITFHRSYKGKLLSLRYEIV